MGLDPFGYHLTSLLLHPLTAGMVHGAVLRVLVVAKSASATASHLPIKLAAGFGALIFSLHPLRVEAVAWASARWVLAPFLPSVSMKTLAARLRKGGGEKKAPNICAKRSGSCARHRTLLEETSRVICSIGTLCLDDGNGHLVICLSSDS